LTYVVNNAVSRSPDPPYRSIFFKALTKALTTQLFVIFLNVNFYIQQKQYNNRLNMLLRQSN
jgi:hypothetical protein